MTKDLALLIGPDQPWLTTEEFLAALDEGLPGRPVLTDLHAHGLSGGDPVGVRSRGGRRLTRRPRTGPGLPSRGRGTLPSPPPPPASRRPPAPGRSADPPNPPPVIRAPRAPAAMRRVDGDVELGAADLVVVAQRGVRRRQQRARPTPSRRRRSALTVVGDPRRSRSRRAGPGGAARRRRAGRGRRPGRPRRRRAARRRPGASAACSHGGAALAVGAVGVAVVHAGVDDEQRAGRRAAGSSGTCSASRVRLSRNSACPAVQRSDASWSIIPVGAPTKSFSARVREPREPRSRRRPRPSRSFTASATAHSSACDDDRPAAERHPPVDEQSRPRHVVPGRAAAPRPRRRRRPPSRPDVPGARSASGDRHVAGRLLDGAHPQHAVVAQREPRRYVRAAIANGSTKPSL